VTITGLRGSNPKSMVEYSATFTADGTNTALGITVDFLPGGGVKIDGVQQGDYVDYTAPIHNRANIFNSGDGSGNDSGVVDIGSFILREADTVSLEVGSKVLYEDDGPGGLGSNAPVTLYEDSLTTSTNPTNGNPDPAPPSQPTTVQASISSLVSGGTDGLQDFALDDTYISDLTSLNLTSGNVALVYEIAAGTVGTSTGDEAGDVLTAYIGSTSGDAAFTVGVTPDGDVEFKLLHAIDHQLVPPAATSDTDLIQTDIGRLFVARDNDNDPFRFAATDVQLNLQDDAPVVDVTNGGTEPGVKYTFDGDQSGGNFQGDEGPTGELPWGDEAQDGSDTSVTTDFSGAFAFAVNPSVGADGGSVTTGYSLALAVVAGTPVMFSGGALTSGGTAVDWYVVSAGSAYAGVLTGTTTEVFRISVNTTSGEVTFEQKAAFDHLIDVPGAPYTTDVLVLDDGQIDVVKTVTVSDGDGGTTYEGDTASDSASVDLGGNFGIGDDGPKADVTLTGAALGVRYTFDGDQSGGNFQGDEGPNGILPWNDEAADGLNKVVTLDFAAAFGTAHSSGADGRGEHELCDPVRHRRRGGQRGDVQRRRPDQRRHGRRLVRGDRGVGLCRGPDRDHHRGLPDLGQHHERHRELRTEGRRRSPR